MTATVAIGCGSAGSGDRVAPAVALASSGLVRWMAFDCLAERTLALAQVRRRRDPDVGYDEQLPRIAAGMAPFVASGGRVVGNFGAANPVAGLGVVVAGLRANGVQGARVAAIHGDDVRRAVIDADVELPELDTRMSAVLDRVVSAHAYIGADSVVPALEQGASFVLAGRLADPSLFVAPICYELGWELDDWHRLGVATAAGHLLECGMQVTGANFADPPYRVVPDLHRLGFPFAVVGDDGVEVAKDPASGGCVDVMGTKLQLLYEVHDPAAYLTPDVTADFSRAEVVEVEKDRVLVTGVTGRSRPATLKVLVGLDLGWKMVGEISFGGPGCVGRARLASDVFEARTAAWSADVEERRADLVGFDSLFGRHDGEEPAEVRLRVAARCRTQQAAQELAEEMTFLYFGPAGAGGATVSVTPFIGVTPAQLPREAVSTEVEVVTT